MGEERLITRQKHRNSWLAVLSALVVISSGCSSDEDTGGSVQDTGTPAEDTQTDTGTIDTNPSTDTGGTETDFTNPFNDIETDTEQDIFFGTPCQTNAECPSGWCVPSPVGKVCTKTCLDDCPNGWTCAPISNTPPDITYVCVSQIANLCRPCDSDGDCASLGVQNSYCLSYGDEGSFCGSPCNAASDCPKGTSCSDITLPNGKITTQCTPDEGICPCNQKAIDESAVTTCKATNEFGTCVGKRFCTDTGLSVCGPGASAEVCNNLDDNCDGITDNIEEVPCTQTNEHGSCAGLVTCTNGVQGCTAPAASPEVCDGQDNNCNGEIDESFSCDDGNPCTDDVCNPKIGCSNNAINCDDGNACTQDFCNPASGCTNTPLNCNDNNACTTDSCEATLGCVFTTLVCNDGDPCNGVESCDKTLGCKPGSALACNDNDVCTNDLCIAFSGCQNAPLDCNDDNPCTLDECSTKTGCTHVAQVCNDNNPCTTDVCDPALGCKFTSINCNDNDGCTTDSCTPEKGCTNLPISCDDGDLCTTDTCNPLTGCKSVSVSCSDGNACNGTEVCNPVTGCAPGTPPDCNDGLTCTTDSCDPQKGCVNQSKNCNDGNACTQDTCDDTGGCISVPLNCDDKNVCNGSESCDTATGCVPGVGIECDDGNPCTADSCDPIKGCVNTVISCDDGNACTVDKCTPGLGCGNTPLNCDDSNICTGAETCNPDTGCVAGATLNCNDNNACTLDSCDPKSGCKTAPIQCNDGNACTEDSCNTATGCTSTVINCDDDDACTTDTCSFVVGCQYTLVKCSDNNICNGEEGCNPASGCTAGSTLNCNDNNPCTVDSCNPLVGCTHAPNADPCNDGNPCTLNDTCAASACKGTPKSCAPDGDPCTLDECNPTTGNCYVAVPNGFACDDQEACTVPDTCVGGFCSGDLFPPCKDPTAQVVCILHGKKDTILECDLNVVNNQPGVAPNAVGIQIAFEYDSTKASLDFFSDGLFCPAAGVCVGPYTIPEPFSNLQSGHIMKLNPVKLTDWNPASGLGYGQLIIVHISAPDTPLTGATLSNGIISGDPVMLKAHFKLKQDIPANNPILIYAPQITATDKDATALAVTVLDLLMQTHE